MFLYTMHNNIVKSEIIRFNKAFYLILLNHISQTTYKIRNGEKHLSELTGQKSEKRIFIRTTTCNPFELKFTNPFERERKKTLYH